MRISGRALRVTAAIGIAPATRNAPLGDLLTRADRALYRAKAARDGVAIYGSYLDKAPPSHHIKHDILTADTPPASKIIEGTRE